MDNNYYDKDLFQSIMDSIGRTLSKNLDTDICTNIQFKLSSLSKVKNVEDLKENNAVYRLDYAVGERQGNLSILIPEELIAFISDILTGGSGEDVYKGSLSEIETNSISKILEKIFKNVESDFKKDYEHDLAFSADAEFLLKEMPEYSIGKDDIFFDFSIDSTLTLTDKNEYKIVLLFNSNILKGVMDDLGLSKANPNLRKSEINQLNVDNLSDIKINITAELGKAKVPIKYALELVQGSLVELDTLNNADIKVYANGVEFAYAQVVAVEDNFGLKITKIISPEERLEYV